MGGRTKGPPPPSSVLVIDKPRGPTSHDVVAQLRRALGTRAIGHCGTLDPMATGVLVAAVEDGTKLVPWLTADDKAYEATVRFGIATDSLDADGRVTGESPVSEELRGSLARLAEGDRESPLLVRALDLERARTRQLPPAISAIRIGGERAHEIARRGEEPELTERDVAVRSLQVLGGGLGESDQERERERDRERESGPFLRLAVHVQKGYFVRSLARDLAASLGTVGHLTALRRTRSGAFTLEDAIALDAGPEALRAGLLPVARAAARALPVSVLTAQGVTAAGHGQRVLPGLLRDPHAGPSAWLDENGALIAIGEADAAGVGRVLRGFAHVKA